MKTSSRFTVAVHALALLALNGRPMSSTEIAGSVNTNPVVIRRLMGELEKAKLVRSVAGRSGGFELDRQADQITLADVYFESFRGIVDQLTVPLDRAGIGREEPEDRA